MISYIRIDIVNEIDLYAAYHNIVMSPDYRWRYSNYSEDINYLRTYIHRSLLRNSGDNYSLSIL